MPWTRSGGSAPPPGSGTRCIPPPRSAASRQATSYAGHASAEMPLSPRGLREITRASTYSDHAIFSKSAAIHRRGLPKRADPRGSARSLYLVIGVAVSVRISQIWPGLGTALTANRAWSGWVPAGVSGESTIVLIQQAERRSPWEATSGISNSGRSRGRGGGEKARKG